ncbi:reprolysin-like metallopeptidase [Flavobacterium sp.]|uniref:reprolysin-like metallopeptidase n=1 Tax=Flavobacterium sp. TaxID=239 RepID=UPI00260D4A4D|nr:zinc-dependent metalloprotease family protein [Flavobacterium sp.]
MKRILLLTVFFNFFLSGYGQQGNLWTRIDADKTPFSEKLEKRSVPTEFKVFQLDINLLKRKLVAAPDRSLRRTTEGVLLQFPNANGVLESYRVYEASVMAPELAAKYQDIKSYSGVGVDDPTATIRFTTTVFGLHSMTFSGKCGTVLIEPYTKDLNKYVVYEKSKAAASTGFECLVKEVSESANRNTNSTQSNTQIFRTYRLAVSCTVEYATFHVNAAGLSGGTLAQKKAAVLAAMVVTMARVNGVYERDAAINLILVSNNDNLINITADNFTNNSGGALLGENQSFVDSNIGSANYDIGHVFSTGGGGIASLGCVCDNTRKAKGVTGSPGPVGDAYDIDYVAHEMGHQFGGNHTFNSDQGSCGGNKNLNTAVEPGSGSTIMAYAGICSPHDVQSNSDAHFSFRTLQEIDAFVASAGNCSSNVSIGNAPPVIGTLLNYVIPKSTPFVLTGNATDDDNDPLTYCWEQNDFWATSALPTATNTGGPNFRSRTPTSSPVRYMPVLSSVVANNVTPAYEVVPSVARTMHFVLTVRDNNPLEGGQTARKDMTVTTAAVGPFAVTAPNSLVAYPAGSNQTVTWDVAGTNANGINCNFVDIYMSTNSGGNFPILLASRVPNDGSELITIPNNVGTTNRIMVMANDNIFYDVSNTNFSITSAPSTFSIAFGGIVDKQNQTGCAGSTIVYPLTYGALGGFSGNTTLSATGNPPGTTITFSPNPVSANGAVTMTVTNTETMAEGFYPIVVTATSGATTKNVNFYLNAIEALFSPISLSSPSNLATNQDTNVVLEWTEDPLNAEAYDIQVATDVSFVNLVQSATVTSSGFQTSLGANTTYYWRVRPRVSACTGSYSTVFRFTTGTLGVGENTLSGFEVYPNPNNGTFSVRSEKFNGTKIQVAVYDMRGRLIFDKNYNASSTFNENIQLNDAQAGIYLLSVSDGQHKVVKRIVVK